MQNLDLTSRAPVLQPPSSPPVHMGRHRAAAPSDSGPAQTAEPSAPHRRRIRARVWQRFALALGKWIIRITVTLLAAFPACSLTLPVAAQSISPVRSRSLTESYGRLPLSFEPNLGQADPGISFVARGRGYGIYVSGREAVLAFRSASASKPSQQTGQRNGGATQEAATDLFRMQLLNANPAPEASGVDPLPGTVNYLVGSDPARWRSAIPTYARAQFKSVYPGIDLVYYGNQQQLEYDFVVTPGASPETIRLHFSGADKVEVLPEGGLTVQGKSGRIGFHAPLLYQTVRGRREPVPGRFEMRANNTVGFRVGSYRHDQALVIDPVLVYSTYLGGSTADEVNGIALDSNGNAYLTGQTSSTDFPVTTGAYQSANKTNGRGTAFVSKLNPAGTALVYSTFLGGSQQDVGYAIAVDSDGNAYVGGKSESDDFPVTKGAFQTTNVGERAFVAKLNPTGTALVYSTFLGGSSSEAVSAIQVDSARNAYVTGTTFSSNFPATEGAFQTSSKDGHTVFVAKLNAAGSALDFATLLGGTDQENGYGLAIDSQGDSFVTGITYSNDFPVTSGAYQATLGSSEGGNAFVAEVNPTGTGLIYSTYLGGSLLEIGNAIAIDGSGNAFVAGFSESSDFPTTTGAFQTTPGAVFVSRLNSTGTALLYSTYLGGVGEVGVEGAYGIAVDSAENAYVTGTTNAGFPVTPGAIQSTGSSGNAFVTRLNPTGTALVYSTYVGGTQGASALAIAIDGSGHAYVAGDTFSSMFPTTTGALQTKNNTDVSYTGFVAELDTNTTLVGTTTTLASNANPQIAGQSVTFTATADASSGSATPSGNVVFAIDGADAATVPLTAGTATYGTSSLAVGPHAVLATYQGDSSFQQSYASLTETIQAAPAATPTFSPAGGAYAGAQSVTISDQTAGATIYYTTNGATPTTSSTKYTGPIVVAATEMIQAMATASGYAPSAIASATFTIQEPMVSLSPGSLNFNSQAEGTSSAAQTVTVQNTGSASLSSIAITLSETGVSSAVQKIKADAAGISSQDYSATTTCGSSLAAGARCTVSVTFSPMTTGSLPGTLQISDNAAGSPQSVSLAGTGTAPVQGDFTVTANPSTAMTTYGGSAQFKISVTATGGPYSSSVGLSASGLPAGATTSYSPPSITPGSGTASSVLTIQTANLNASNSRTAPLWPVGSSALALLFFAVPRRLRKQWSRRVISALLILASISVAAVLIGCGGGFALPQPATTSTITITAAGGSDVHTTTVQLTVK
jgi:hypothetical protein